MSKKTIAKFTIFVILIGLVSLFFSACSFGVPQAEKKSSSSKYTPPVVRGKIESSDITESSGLAASKCQAGVLWTHNDSGDDAYIFAIDTQGKDLGTWKVPNAENLDWEDIAATKALDGKCFIYIGETGDNKRSRAERTVYRVAEPAVSESQKSSRKNPQMAANADVLKYTYPEGSHDAESLAVHPKSGDIYVLTKRLSGPAGIYRIKPNFNTGAIVKADKIGDIAVPAIPNGLLTGADISPDGRSVIICDYAGGYELNLPENSNNFDDIWKQKPEPVDLGDRKGGESVCYSADGKSIFATSEGKHSPVIEVKRL